MRKFITSLVCAFMVASQLTAFPSAADARRRAAGTKVNKSLKGYDELLRKFEVEIEDAVKCGKFLTVVQGFSSYKLATIEAVIARLKEDGYTVQTNTNKHKPVAVVVSWEERK